MRVTLLTSSISRRAAGMLESVRGLARSLRESGGIEVSALGLMDADTSRDLATWGDVPLHVAPVRGPSYIGFSPRLDRMLHESAPDLVHMHGLWKYPSLVCLRWARRMRKPYLVTPHGMLHPLALAKNRWKKRLAGWAYQNAHLRKAACLHALGESEALAMRTLGLRNPVCVIANGVVPPPASDGIPPPWEDVLPGGAKVLLYLGRLHAQKNLVNLVRAWRLARDTPGWPTERWHLVLAGWDQGGYGRQLSALARELDVDSSVHLVGPQYGESKHATFRRASGFVLPSLFEALPTAVLEAWSYGVPVLMTRGCNLPEGFQAGAARSLGLGVADMARDLVRWFSASEAERRAMGERGRQLVLARHNWGGIATQMVAVYRWLLGGPAPAGVEILP